MTENMRKLYKAGKNDVEFLAAIKSADNDDPPGPSSSKERVSLFIAMYYGYRVAKYGDNWDVGI